MRIVAVLAMGLALSLLAPACSPQASGPPAGGEATVAAPASTPAAGETPAAAPAVGETPAAGETPAMPPGHPGMPPSGDMSPGAMPPGHPPMGPGASPPAGHTQEGGFKSITETEGNVVAVNGDEMILARPSGTELKFILPKDMKVSPEGKTRADLKEGVAVMLKIRHVDQGMEVSSIELLDLPPAKK